MPNQTKTLKWIIGFLTLTILVLFFLLLGKLSTDGGNFTSTFPDSTQVKPTNETFTTIWYDSSQTLMPRGECLKVQPATGTYVKLTVTLKGKNIRMPVFNWADKDYANPRGCFRTTAADVIAMSSFVKQELTESKIYFHGEVRSSVYDNEFDFSIKVEDRNGKMIGKYPTTGETEKKKVVNIKYPATLDGAIQFENAIAWQ